MAKPFLKQKAIELRKSGQSYSQIRQQLRVSKGTLSAWLEDYPLSPERIRELRDRSERRIERYKETRRKQREANFLSIYDQERSNILPLSTREKFLCGLFLYWGEGLKVGRESFALSNTDVRMISFFVHWATEILKVPKAKLVSRLHLYGDMDVEKEIIFWSEALGMSIDQFRKPYIKQSMLAGLSYKKGFGHGTCNIIVYDAMLCKKILMGIKSIGDSFYRGPVA